MRNFRWGNVPIPQGHVFILAAGLVLHVCLPLMLFESAWLKQVVGWPIFLLGILLTIWAVTTIQNMDISRPTKIIISGPYAFSRNPMYVAWTAIYVGIAILVNTGWPILFLPALLAFTHYFVVRRVEQALEQQFGEAYRQYCEQVRRYL
jgi:protein-S-isoprenylcysteine O-methyltransferase Ste14